MAELTLEIITPEKPIFNDTIESVTIPGTMGGFQILKDHAPLMSSFEIGIVKVRQGSADSVFATAGGTVEVKDNKVLVLADSIEKIADIDKDRAEKAKERAEERLRKKNLEEIDEARAAAALGRALNRINALKKYKV